MTDPTTSPSALRSTAGASTPEPAVDVNWRLTAVRQPSADHWVWKHSRPQPTTVRYDGGHDDRERARTPRGTDHRPQPLCQVLPVCGSGPEQPAFDLVDAYVAPEPPALLVGPAVQERAVPDVGVGGPFVVTE